MEIAQGQAPFAAYVTCSDSRVSPEFLFGRGLGELFIIRHAGNTVDLGPIEYAGAQLGVPLVVVMGHEACGAVKAIKAVVDDNATFPGIIVRMPLPKMTLAIPYVSSFAAQNGPASPDPITPTIIYICCQLRRGP
nr:carbonic anhydrase [Qipengyuania algicida]